MTRLILTTAVFLFFCCTYSWRTGDCRAVDCIKRLYSRLDILSCAPHKDTSWPGPNEYALYRTFIRNRVPDCIYRNPNANSKFEIIRPIDDLGNPNVRLLYSPGYLLNRNYADNILVNYSVQCPKGRLPFLVYNEFHLQNKECHDRCEDYVTISCADCGSSESCGTEPTDRSFQIWQERFSVTFRTSQVKNDAGFVLSVICFDPIDLNKPGCSNAGVKKRDLEIYRNMWRKHAERIHRRVATPGPQPSRVEVDLRDVVTYRGSTITVSRGGEVVRRIENITHLVINDTIGEDRSFLSDAVELRPGGVEETVRLRGPGELLLLSSNATLLRDSQAFTMSANEKEICKNLASELFNLVPSSNDLDITDIIEELQEDELSPTEIQPRVPSRRAAAVAPFTSFPSHLVSTSAIRQSILNENSCNPVIKAAATSTLSIATRQSPSRVENVRKSLS